MECPKCGYERESGDTHCSLCGVDFDLLEQQKAEKKALKNITKNGGSLQAGDLALETGKDQTAASSSGDVVGECPKCGFSRRSDENECRHCGVIFEKHEQLTEQKKTEAETRKRKEQQRIAEKHARIQEEAKKGIQAAQVKRAREQEVKKQADKAREEENQAEGDAADKPSRAVNDQVDKAVTYLKGNQRKFAVAVVAIVAVLVVGWGVTALVKNWMAGGEQKRIIAQQEEARRKLADEYKKTADEYYTNKAEIDAALISIIDRRYFDLFDQKIKKYDIPPLENDMSRIKKYLEEIKLVDRAKSIPGREYETNYRIYSKLYQMNPRNKGYAKKVKIYRKKLADKNYRDAKSFFSKKERFRSDLRVALAEIDKAIQLEGPQKKYRKLKVQLKNAGLLFYEGNDQVQMAVRNDGVTKGATGGQRKIYVWIKNISTEPFFVNVDFFTMVGSNNKRYSYNDCSRKLLTQLQPGKETEGYLYFYTSTKPRKLVFSHVIAGTISRRFP